MQTAWPAKGLAPQSVSMWTLRRFRELVPLLPQHPSQLRNPHLEGSQLLAPPQLKAETNAMAEIKSIVQIVRLMVLGVLQPHLCHLLPLAGWRQVELPSELQAPLLPVLPAAHSANNASLAMEIYRGLLRGLHRGVAAAVGGGHASLAQQLATTPTPPLRLGHRALLQGLKSAAKALQGENLEGVTAPPAPRLKGVRGGQKTNAGATETEKTPEATSGAQLCPQA